MFRKWLIIGPIDAHVIAFQAWSKASAKRKAKRIAARRGWSSFRMVAT
jgi:hypothetical protein